MKTEMVSYDKNHSKRQSINGKEFDTYKVGSVANSCSTMHKIAEKEFTLEDFSCEHLINSPLIESEPGMPELYNMQAKHMLEIIIGVLNAARFNYLKTKDKKYWWQMIQLLPSSYNQTRNVMLNYEVLANIYKSRKNHKLDEWREFCKWIENLPYSELICGTSDSSYDDLIALAKNCPNAAREAVGLEPIKEYDTAEYAKDHPEWEKKIKRLANVDKES